MTPSVYPGFYHLNSTTALAQFQVATASNQAGTRVAAWTSQYNETDLDVHARIHTCFGAMLGPEIVVSNTGAV